MSHTLISRSGADRVLRSRKKIVGEIIAIGILLCDVAAIISVSTLSGIAYHWAVYGETGDIMSFLRIGSVVATVVVVTNLFRAEYQLSNFLSFAAHAGRTAQLWSMTFVCLLIIGFMGKVTEGYSRGWVVLYFLCGLFALLSLRYLAVRVVLRFTAARLIATKRVFLVGDAQEIEAFIAGTEPQHSGIDIVGCRFLSDAAQSGLPQDRQRALQREIAAVLPSIRHLEPDAIFIITSWSDQQAIDRCIEELLTLPVEIHLGPGHALRKYPSAQLMRLGPVASLQLIRLPLSRVELLQKRFFDLMLSTLGLVLLAPFLVLVAILIKLDSRGPVLFMQRRYGFNQSPFRIIKFRTMVTLDDGPDIRQAQRDDPRVTRVGRWLRASNIDELPQLINVIKGEMSLVGPRPHALSHDREYEHIIARYARRHNVKPGITGWAQVHGIRGETDTPDKMRKRVEYDLTYIENWSLGRDLLILLRTVVSPAAYRNAR